MASKPQMPSVLSILSIQSHGVLSSEVGTSLTGGWGAFGLGRAKL